jgi:predicted enzyme related to lactoylglutathione lyase
MTAVFKQHGAFSWTELMTTDPEGEKEFYSELFGWETDDMPMGDMTYTVLKAGDKEVGGIMPIPEQAKGTHPYWGIYVTVDDVDATAKKAEELGAKTIVPLTDIPDVGRLFAFQDPQGAIISAITYARK